MKLLKSLAWIISFLAFLSSAGANSAFFPKEFSGVVSVQSLPVGRCILKCFYFGDTTTYQDAGYIPLSAGIGVDFAFLFGYLHSIPKLIFETSIGGDGEDFWGIGGALAFEAHPLKSTKNDPYLYCNFGYINMPAGGYEGHGYHFDIGGGFMYPVRSTIKICPFIAYTPISQWIRRKQVGYMLVDPIIGPEPAYEGRTCKHAGMRVGVSFMFGVFGGK